MLWGKLWESKRDFNTSWGIDIGAPTVMCLSGRWQEYMFKGQYLIEGQMDVIHV
jgi:hypothetical protein